MTANEPSTAETVRRRVKRFPKGRPFTLKRFNDLGSQAREAVGKAIARLVQSGELERVYRGVYMRPKLHRLVGRVRPSAETVARVIAKERGQKIQCHGAEAVRRLGLSMQMAITPIYYTSGPSRVVQIGNHKVKLVHVSANKLQHVGTKVGLVFTALFYFGRKAATNPKIISAIRGQLTQTELHRLRSSRIPKWMHEAFEASS